MTTCATGARGVAACAALIVAAGSAAAGGFQLYE